MNALDISALLFFLIVVLLLRYASGKAHLPE
jgi:hypothetical protein